MTSFISRRFLAFFLVLWLGWSCILLETSALDLRSWHDSLQARYTRAHSLGDNYQFDTRDGWQVVNASNLQYKYSRRNSGDYAIDEYTEEEDTEDAESPPDYSNNTLITRAAKNKSQSKVKASAKDKKTSKASTKSKSVSKSGSITSKLGSIMNSFKGVGKAEPVTITWYTGHDLENPSCWSNPTWAPSDNSFAAALTLEGWTTRPKCFKFLELCNTPKKCVFVRVVDSCAGCAKGSKHVDLTQAPFKQLASLDAGLLQVHMRQATDPEGWLLDLWGPKA